MRKQWYWLFTLIISVEMVSTLTVYALSTDEHAPSITIRNFEQVDTALYRGAQPDEAGFQQLRAMGITTVINFRHERKRIERERRIVEALGMNYVSLPWNLLHKPHAEMYKQFFAIARDPKAQPVFYHCRRGVERTGTITAVYKMKTFSFSANEALRDIKRFGIKWYFYPFVRGYVRAFDPACIASVPQPQEVTS